MNPYPQSCYKENDKLTKYLRKSPKKHKKETFKDELKRMVFDPKCTTTDLIKRIKQYSDDFKESNKIFERPQSPKKWNSLMDNKDESCQIPTPVELPDQMELPKPVEYRTITPQVIKENNNNQNLNIQNIPPCPSTPATTPSVPLYSYILK